MFIPRAESLCCKYTHQRASAQLAPLSPNAMRKSGPAAQETKKKTHYSMSRRKQRGSGLLPKRPVMSEGHHRPGSSSGSRLAASAADRETLLVITGPKRNSKSSYTVYEAGMWKKCLHVQSCAAHWVCLCARACVCVCELKNKS